MPPPPANPNVLMQGQAVPSKAIKEKGQFLAAVSLHNVNKLKEIYSAGFWKSEECSAHITLWKCGDVRKCSAKD